MELRDLPLGVPLWPKELPSRDSKVTLSSWKLQKLKCSRREWMTWSRDWTLRLDALSRCYRVDCSNRSMESWTWESRCFTTMEVKAWQTSRVSECQWPCVKTQFSTQMATLSWVSHRHSSRMRLTLLCLFPRSQHRSSIYMMTSSRSKSVLNHSTSCRSNTSLR